MTEPRQHARRIAFLLTLSAATTACGSDDLTNGATPGGSNTGGNSSANGGSSSGGSNASSCEPGPGYSAAEVARSVRRVTGRLLDGDGDAIGGELVQVCGLDVCISGKTGSDGAIAIETDQRIKRPALKFGEGLESARFAWLLPEGAEVALGDVHGVRLPPIEEGVPLVAGETAKHGGLELEISAQGAIVLDRLTFQTTAEQGLRAVRVPLESAPEAVPPELGLELLYAATPSETRFCPPARVRVENSEGWAPGSEVEVYLHGVAVEQEFAPYGEFARVSDARVSDDGAYIETTEPGLAVLGVLGFKRK